MNRVGNSFIRRIVLVMGGLVALTFLILGSVWRYYGSVLEKNREDEISHLLKVYADSLDFGLSNTDMNLLTIAQEQSLLEELSNPDEAKRYYASMQLLDLIRRLRSNNEGVDMLLTVGNYADSVSDAGAGMTLQQRDEIVSFMEKRREERKEGGRIPTGTKGWVVQRTGETVYLLRTYDALDYSVSAWIRLDSLVENIRRLEENSDKHIFLLGKENAVLGSSRQEDAGEYENLRKMSKGWEQPVGNRGLVLICLMENSSVYGQMQLMPVMIFMIILMMLALLLWLCWYVRREIFLPIRELIQTISFIRLGDYRHRITKKCTNREFASLNETFNSMMDTIVELRIREYERQIRLQETELKYFQMQIRPHFFLNALSTIHSMSYENRGEDIRAFTEAFSRNIRYMFKAGLHTVKLWEEWEHLDHYFEMQELLYPGCVFYYIDRREEIREWNVPQMLLHTFMENKFKHSVKVGKLLSIYISAKKEVWKDKNVLRIVIEDNGTPFPEDMVHEWRPESLREDGSGVGLLNVKRTLEIMYGETGLLKFFNPSEGGSRIELLIPEQTVMQEGAYERAGC